MRGQFRLSNSLMMAHVISRPSSTNRHTHMRIVSPCEGRCTFDIEAGKDLQNIFRIERFTLDIREFNVVTDVHL